MHRKLFLLGFHFLLEVMKQLYNFKSTSNRTKQVEVLEKVHVIVIAIDKFDKSVVALVLE